MTLQTLKNQIISLPLQEKLILSGSLLTILGMFLPVYSDLSQWGKGVVYFGITGPLALNGIGIIISSLIPILAFLVSMQILDLKKIKLNLTKTALFGSLQSILLLILMSYTFLHQDFGVSVTVKELRIGIICAFIGALINLAGAYMNYKNINLKNLNEKIPEKSFIELPLNLKTRIHQTVKDFETDNNQEKIETKKQYADETQDHSLSKENYNLRMNL
jgi:hypothetical protein